VNSKVYDENDIYIYAVPEWSNPDYPEGLAYFDPEANCAIILGLEYFGEFKKGTLTLAWGMASRNNYVSCHGGLKRFTRDDDSTYVTAFYGLSGSGKSTLTHAKHNGKYKDIVVLHDDAFIINRTDGSAVALEPSYFDKTHDYPLGHREQKYFVTVQNCAVTLDREGKKVLVTEDVRNGNGRTVKSRYSTPNRVDKTNEPIDSIFWIMKDESMPPVLKLSNPVLSSTMGAMLLTRRSTAENVKDQNALAMVPYANPFRVYPLEDDYYGFKAIFEKNDVDCYIINTGKFIDKDIAPATTLGILEAIVDGTAEFRDFPLMEGTSYMDIEGYEVPLDDQSYVDFFTERMQVRLDYMNENMHNDDHESLPEEAHECIQSIVDKLNKK